MFCKYIQDGKDNLDEDWFSFSVSCFPGVMHASTVSACGLASSAGIQLCWKQQQLLTRVVLEASAMPVTLVAEFSDGSWVSSRGGLQEAEALVSWGD